MTNKFTINKKKYVGGMTSIEVQDTISYKIVEKYDSLTDEEAEHTVEHLKNKYEDSVVCNFYL